MLSYRTYTRTFFEFCSVKNEQKWTKNTKNNKKTTKKPHKVQEKVLKKKNKTNIRVDKVEKGAIMKP